MVFLTASFARVFPEKRLEIKSLKGQTKTEAVGDPAPELLSVRLSLKALFFEPFLRKSSRKMAEPREHRGGADPLLRNGSCMAPEICALDPRARRPKRYRGAIRCKELPGDIWGASLRALRLCRWFDETAAHTCTRLSRIAWCCRRSSIGHVSTGGSPTACDAATKPYE
jgi:hypothetical protein